MIQIDKTEYMKKEVSYLGYVIIPEGVRPNPDKIQASVDYPIASNQKELRGFLGLLGYYRRFIKDFAHLTKPLTKCLKKNAQVKHTPEFLECFQKCQEPLTNYPILQYPEINKPFILTKDTYNVALGAVLSQDETSRNVANFSTKVFDYPKRIIWEQNTFGPICIEENLR